MSVEPRATYRVQLHASFGFDEAAALTDYLHALGVSHLYCSPYLQAAAGSSHGYDVTDPTRVSDERGGREGHDRLCAALARHGLGQVLDIVPNHMAIGRDNPWWWDVLENGPSSRFASYFDVDWDGPEQRLRNLVLLPILGDHYGRILEAGELRVDREGGSFTVRYHDHAFPAAPRSLGPLLGRVADRSGSDQLGFLADAFSGLPLPTATDEASLARRHRDQEILRNQLAVLLAREHGLAAALDAELAALSGDADALDAYLEAQNHRLAFWRAASRDLGYRRFFDVNSLVGLRVESAPVFRDSHSLVLSWVAAGRLDGLRVDHPDGLRDPEEYLRRLRDGAPEAWIVVEKILEPGEALVDSWPVAGTTGYDFLNLVLGLFIDRSSEQTLTELYAGFIGTSPDWPEIVRESKHHVMRDLLGSDVNRLTALLLEICERHRRYRDYTRHELHEALRETLACFAVYRSYVRAAPRRVSAEDESHVTSALQAAKRWRPDLDPELFDFLGDLLLLRLDGERESELALRFQQLSGPVMAKGVEDTAFYRFNRFVALNEVGGEPSRFGVTVEEFHRACAAVQKRWPLTMLSTSTHDTKRGEDVRARLAVLTELPEEWASAVAQWAALNEAHWGGQAPDRNLEYLLYQTLVGAWPVGIERIRAYVEKAAREAKVSTSWNRPVPEHEAALQAFVEGALASAEFRQSLDTFVGRIAAAGRENSLAQTLLKLTAPGVPDLYQGCELWDLSLVDPDNRRPVDFALRRRLLAEVSDMTPESMMARSDEGLPKLWLVRQALALRRERPELFGPSGSYEPLTAQGKGAAHVVAFCRGAGAISVAPRLCLRLGGWGDTSVELPSGRWRNVLTSERADGGPAALAAILGRFPVALLSRETGR